MLVMALRLVQVALLAAALPLALIAASGYRDAPFGAVLRPLVPVVVLYLLLAGGQVLYPGGLHRAESVIGGIGLLLIAYATYQLVMLLTGRRAV